MARMLGSGWTILLVTFAAISVAQINFGGGNGNGNNRGNGNGNNRGNGNGNNRGAAFNRGNNRPSFGGNRGGGSRPDFSGGNSRPSFNNGGGSRPSFNDGGSNSGGVNFGSGSPSNNGGDSNGNSVSSIADILNKNGGSPPQINTRFNTKRYGSQCTTPFGQAGSCRYIFDSPCRPILSAIIQQGISNQILQYIFSAIRSPCGFEGFDFTLCCEDNSVVTNPPTPTPGPTPPPTQPPSNGECGIPANGNRIIGGTVARAGSWPWAVILGRSSFGRFQVVCGGTLLDRNTVLTAAHCFESSSNPTLVRVGDTDISSSSDGVGQDINIRSVNKHPGWNPVTLSDDIAILKLSQDVGYTSTTRYACLPTQYQNQDLSQVIRNPDPYIIGWGSTRVGGGSTSRLMQAQVPMVTQSQCSNAYNGVGQVTIGDTKICAGGNGKDTCNGDSGGALLASNLGGSFSVVGITSFGVDCARPEYPGVYTRVDKYLSWIRGFM